MMDKEEKHPFKDQLVGRLFMGRYRLVRRLAAGGMGVVYLARAEGAEGFVKPVVVKLIHPHFESVPKFSSMFIREAQIMSNLQHSGIVNVIDFAKEDHTHVMVLEYVSGYQLKQWSKFRKFKGNPLPTEVIIQIMINVLGALSYAHTLKRPDGQSIGIIHRDISMANILVDVEGRVKLLDFGIAFVNEGTEKFATRNTGFKGKLPYSSPEFFGGGKASVLSDVYACGVVLHELLLGKNEFASRDEQEIINRIMNKNPSPVLRVRPDAPPQIDEILQKAMAKNPEDRFASADEFRCALQEINVEDEQTATTLLSMLVEQDFGVEMAKFLRVESVADRDRAWRNPSIIPRQAKDDGASGAHRTPSTTSSPGSGRVTHSAVSFRKKTTIALALLLLLVIGLGVFIFLRKPESASETPIFVVQSPVSEEEATTADQSANADKQGELEQISKEASDTATGENDSEEDTGKSIENLEDKKPAASKPKGRKSTDLGAAFRKRKNDVKKCFKQHAMNLDGQPKIFINFEIDQKGKVQKSSLSPSSIGGTSLGGCLLKVANSTRFSPQNEPVAFRIPVTTWRVTTD